MSFFVSRTVTPLLCLYMLKGHLGEAERGRAAARSAARWTRVDHAYARSLGWVLRHRADRRCGRSWRSSACRCSSSASSGRSSSPTATSRSSRSTSRRRSGRASSGPRWSPQKIEDAVNETLANDGRADRDHDDRRTSACRSGGRRSSRRTPGRTRATCRSTWCRGPSAGVRTCRRPRRCAAALRDALPGTQVYFFIGGIVKRILNFGAPAPIDVEILGHDLEAGAAYAKQVIARAAARSTTADGKPLADRRADLARGELPRARRRRRPREGRACSACPSSRSRRPC